MEIIPFVCGIALVLLVLLQMVLALSHSVRRMGSEAVLERLALREWKHRVKAAQLRVEKTEDEKEHWSGWRKFEVRRKIFENELKDICSFYLYPHDRRPLPPFKPGQFLMVKAEIADPGDPYNTIEEQRCYSLSDSHNPRYYRVSIKACPPPRENPENFPPGLVSNHFHQSVNEGDLIDIMAPSGDFFLDMESTNPVVLNAGGVGITPVLCMLNSIVDRGTPRETWFFYGVRGPKELVMMQALRHAVDNMKNVHVVICFSDTPIDGYEEIHGMENSSIQYQKGRVGVDLYKELLPSNNYSYYTCGPEPMMLGIEKQLIEWGVPKNRIHYELFAPPSEESEEGAGAAVAAPGQTFNVSFAATEKALTWSGEKNILSLTKKHKLTVKRIKYTCRQGKCGSCQTAIRAGAVAYPGGDPTFEVKEGHCLPCCCVPASDLELEA